jgi:MYXO-CTERM domain-containing protein
VGLRLKRLHLLLVAAVTLLTTARASALDYYVDSVSGNDTRDGRSEANAWRTIDHLEAAASLRAGDRVYLRAGSDFDLSALGDSGLRLTRTESGTASSPILVTRYGTGPAPILRNPTGTTDRRLVSVEGGHVVIDGLELSYAHYAGVYIEGSVGHVTVRNCDIHHVGVGVVAFAPDLLITRNHLHDGTMVVNTVGGDDDYGANGIVASGSRIEISYNAAERLRAASYDYVVDGGFVELFDASTDISVHHNVVRDSVGFTEGGSGRGETIARASFAYNLSIGNGGFSTFHNGGDGFSATFVDCTLSNNTIFDTEPGTVFWFSAPAGSTVTVRNNVISVPGGRVFLRPGTVAHTHNVFPPGVPLGLTPDATDLVADPLFVDAAAGDPHLSMSSPAIDSGAPAAFAADLDGVPVPSGAGVDRGAYERPAVGVDAGMRPGDAGIDGGRGGDAGVRREDAGTDGGDRRDAAPLDDARTATDAAIAADSSTATDASVMGGLDAAFDDAGLDRDAAVAAPDAPSVPREAGTDAGPDSEAGMSTLTGSCACRAGSRGPAGLAWGVLGVVLLLLRRRAR